MPMRYCPVMGAAVTPKWPASAAAVPPAGDPELRRCTPRRTCSGRFQGEKEITKRDQL